MSTTAATGFCRVTVVAPDSRIDVALPEDIAVADVYPEILRLTGQTQTPGTPTGYHLVRRDGTVLDGARTLSAQQILDGEVLSLRPFAESLPRPSMTMCRTPWRPPCAATGICGATNSCAPQDSWAAWCCWC